MIVLNSSVAIKEEMTMDKEPRSVQDQQLKILKFQTLLLILLLAAALIFAAYAGGKINAAMEVVEGIDVAQINEAVVSVKSAADTVAEIDTEKINDAITTFSDASEDLEGLDVEKINDLIDSLAVVSDKMETASNILEKIFGK